MFPGDNSIPAAGRKKEGGEREGRKSGWGQMYFPFPENTAFICCAPAVLTRLNLWPVHLFAAHSRTYPYASLATSSWRPSCC